MISMHGINKCFENLDHLIWMQIAINIYIYLFVRLYHSACKQISFVFLYNIDYIVAAIHIPDIYWLRRIWMAKMRRLSDTGTITIPFIADSSTLAGYNKNNPHQNLFCVWASCEWLVVHKNTVPNRWEEKFHFDPIRSQLNNAFIF